MRLATRIDRYPAKMVSVLAERLVCRYAATARRILDPFCGSAAILHAARRRGIASTGIDINPIAALFSRVKLRGFDPDRARELVDRWITKAHRTHKVSPVIWPGKTYWFTRGTLVKYEYLRAAAQGLNLSSTDEGTALLLAFALSVRLCSRADQRSPKPFISKQARFSREGRHFNPYDIIPVLLEELAALHAPPNRNYESRFLLVDLPNTHSLEQRIGTHSHIITSPPYINAQDYFRNFKLELYLIESLYPFAVEQIRNQFIGTDRGDLLRGIPDEALDWDRKAIPGLESLEERSPRLSAVVHRYFFDMDRSFVAINECLEPKGHLILVCGDNLVGGLRIRTWQVLEKLLERQGYTLFDRFSDPIGDRLLAPKRSGHKGLIKEEIVSAFRRS